MAVRERDIEVHPHRIHTPPQTDTEPPIGELFRQLSDDAAVLVRQEIELGKAELRATARVLARDAVKLGIAASLAWFGAMAAITFVILALGALLDSYWISALIVAVVLLATGAVLATNAKADLQKRDLKPKNTIDTVRGDVEWAKQEMQDVKRELKADRR